MPPELFGWADDVTTYDYDPDRARELIAESGVTDLTLPFWYPTDVSRPYMPNPQANFELIKADLEAVGFTVEPKTAPWNPDYLDATQTGGTPMFLLGWTGDFGDPDNFVGTFFQTVNPQFGSFENEEIFAKLDEAEAETDLDGADGALPGGQPADHGLPAGRSRTSTTSRRSPSPQAIEGLRTGPAEQRELRPGDGRRVRSLTDVLRFVVRRVLQLVPILFGLSLLPVRLAARTPGRACRGPPGRAGDARAGRQHRAALRARPTAGTCSTGSSSPGRCTFDFGNSARTHRPVIEEMVRTFPATIELAIAAMIFAVGVGIPLGYYAARTLRHLAGQPVGRRARCSGSPSRCSSSPTSSSTSSRSSSAGSRPSGRQDPRSGAEHPTGFYVLDGLITGNPAASWDAIMHLILPAIALGTIPLAIIIRITRASVLDVVHEDYVRTAEAKGLHERTITRRHVLRNALLPVVTVIGLQARPAALRRDPDRDGLRLRRGRPVRRRGDQQPGLRRDPGLHLDHRGHVRDREPRRRRVVRVDRPRIRVQ